MQNEIKQAIKVLTTGGLVAFPTETVYGLGADARNEQAIQKVFAAKGRPSDHPLIVHIADLQQLANWAIDIPAPALLLAQHFWPGPLTLILKKHPQVSSLITGGQDTVAIRIPQHPLTLAMLEQFNSGIVGPSANTYGRISPTTADHVAKDLGNKVDYILDGGSCSVGIESTIVYFLAEQPLILRQGQITPADIDAVLGYSCKTTAGTATNIRAPGHAKAHYAPQKPLFLVPTDELTNVAAFLQQKDLHYSCLCFKPQQLAAYANLSIYSAAISAPAYATNLYALLHTLDAEDTQGIIIEMPPIDIAWAAILDRLTRASIGELTLEKLQNNYFKLS